MFDKLISLQQSNLFYGTAHIKDTASACVSEQLQL